MNQVNRAFMFAAGLGSFLAIFLQPVIGAPVPDRQPSAEDFSNIAKAVLQLVQSGDTNAFSKSVSPTMEEFRKVTLKTNAPNPFTPEFEKQQQVSQKFTTASAQAFSALQARLKIDAARANFNVAKLTKKSIGSVAYPWADLPWCEEVQITLRAEPSEASNNLRGDYIISVGQLLKLPDGWRANRASVRWAKLPDAVGDKDFLNETRILEAVSHDRALSDAEDPALRKFGTNVIEFLRSADERVYEQAVMVSFESVWKELEKAGRAISRKDFEEGWKQFTGKSLRTAHDMAKQTHDWGIDLHNAEIKLIKVAADNLMHRGPENSVNNLDAHEVTLVYDVVSIGQSKTGARLSGQYVVVVQQVRRRDGEWKSEGGIRWKKFPDGVVAKADLEKIAFEDYVTEHGTFPVGTSVPEIEFAEIGSNRQVKLSDFRNKFVVLDFWATTCGPCQPAMAELQKLVTQHPEWTNKLQVISLSIDDTEKVALKHLQSRGWTNTLNGWAGPGDWQSVPAKTFRVQGIPTSYLIDPNGKVVRADLGGSQIELLLQRTLKQ